MPLRISRADVLTPHRALSCSARLLVTGLSSMWTSRVSPRLATIKTAAGEVLGESTGKKAGDWRGAGVLHGG